MRLYVVTPLVVSFALQSAKAIEDGFYYQKRSDKPALVEYQNGNTDGLDGRVEVDIEFAEIFSVTNDNTEFHLLIRTAEGSSLDVKRTRALVLDGTTYRESSAGSILYFRITGEDNAKQVAKYVEVEILQRRHPNHQLQFSISPAREEFETNGTVELVITYRNVGNEPIKFRRGGRQRGSNRDNQYSFFAKLEGRTVPDVGSERNFGGMARTITLSPREFYREKIDLSKLFSFESSGRYFITGVIELEYEDPKRAHPSRVIWKEGIAAKTAVTITPTRRKQGRADQHPARRESKAP
ncbi:MAG: hypothetical protein AAGA58_00145 [Verrucomicrobiota bacterium]